MKTEELLSSTGETFEYARIYAEQQKEYLRLEVSKRIAKTTSALVTVAVISFFAFMVILFLSISVGFLLGNLWGSYGVAFLLLTGIYALAAILIYFFKKRLITNPIVSLIIKDLLD